MRKNDLPPGKLRLVRFADCAFGGEDGVSCSGGLLILCDSFPGGTFRVLSWPSRILRQVVRSALGSEALSSIDATELLQDVKRFRVGVFGRHAPAIASTACKSFPPHLREGASPTASLLNTPFLQSQTMLNAGTADDVRIIEGADNPADPPTLGLSGPAETPLRPSSRGRRCPVSVCSPGSAESKVESYGIPAANK